MGAQIVREAKSADAAGDSTTTATVLAAAFLSRCSAANPTRLPFGSPPPPPLSF